MTMAGGPGGGSVEVGAVSFRIGVDLSQFQQDLARAEELARQRANAIQQHFNSLSMQATGIPQEMAGSGTARRPRPRATEQARAGQQQLPGMDRFQQRLGQTQAAAAADSQAAQGAQPLPTPEPPPPAAPAPVERVRRVRTRDYHTTETGAPEPVSPPTPVSQQRQIETRDVRSSIAPQPTPEPPPPAKKIEVQVPPQIVAIPGPPPSQTLPYTQVPTSSGQPMFVPSRASGPQQTQRTVPPTVSGIPAPQRPTVHIPPTSAPPPPPPVGTRHGVELSGREVGQPAHPPAVTTTVSAALATAPAPAAAATPVAAAVQKQVSEVESAVAATIDGVTQTLKGQIVQWTGAAGARMQGRVVSEKPGGKLRVNVGGAYASTQRENVTLPYGYEQAGGAAPPPAAPTQTPAPEPVAPTPAPAAPPPPRAPRTPRAPRPPPVYGPYGAAAPRAEPTVSPAPPALPRSGEPPRVHFEPAEEGAFFKPAYVLSTSGIYKAEVPAVRGVSRSQNTQTALSQYFSGAAPKVKPSEFPPYARHLALERQAEAIEARERAERVAAAEVAGPKPAGPTVRPGEVQQLPDVGPALGPEELLPPVAPLEIKPLEGEASVIQTTTAPRVPPSRRYEYQRSKSIAEELTTGAQPAIEAYREGQAPVRTMLSRAEAAQRLLEQRRRAQTVGAATAPIRALEHGGYAEAGKVHLIGERGPELFVPREAGYVLSNEQTRELGGLVAARAAGGTVKPEDSVEYKVQQFVRQHKGKGFTGEQLLAHFQSLGLEVPGGKFGGAAMPGSKDFDALLKAVPTARYWYEQIGSGLEQRLGAPVFNEAAFLTAITSPRTAVDDNVAAALSGMGWIRELEAAGHPVGQRVTQADIDAAKAEHAKKLADFAELQQRRTDAVPVFEAARRANDAAAASRLLRGPAGAPSLVSGRLKAARDWTPEIWEDLHDKLQKSLTAKKPVLQTLKIGDIRASDELQKLWQETPGTLRVNVSKATLNNLADAYLNGFATAGGFKTPSYYSNIGAGRARMPDPYTTIDTWMAGVFGYGMSKGQAEVAAADPQLFRAMHAAVTELGAQHGLHGYQMQAALWVPFKTLVEAARAKGAEREQVAARQMLAGEISPAEAVKIAHETGLFGKATGSWADVEHTDQVQAALQRLEKHGLGGAGLQPAGGKLAGAQLVFKGTKDQGAGQPHRGVSRTQQQAFAAAGGQDPIRFAITSTPLLTKELEKAGIGAKAAGGPTATFAISETMARLEKAGLVPAQEVGERLLGGPRDLPAYMAPVSEFMGEQSARIARGALSQEEVATAYLTTLSSIRGQEISVAAAEAKAGGLDLSGALSTVKGKAKVRPEDAFAEWIKTAGGQKALQDIHDGRIEQVQHAIHAARMAQMGGFGFPSFYGKKKSPEPAPVFRTPKPGRYNLHNIQQATDAFNEAGASGKLGAVEQVASQFEGIGAGKTGFLASWLGSARLPTLDVNALKTWLGDEGGALAVKAMGSARGMRTVGPELQQAVIGRHREMQSLGYLRGVPEDQLPGVMHWTLFDAAKLAETTHHPIFQAMRAARRAAGGSVSRYYHGTKADFQMAEPSRRGLHGPGLYVSSSPDIAANWAGTGEGANIRPLDVPKDFKWATQEQLYAEVRKRAGVGRHEPLGRTVIDRHGPAAVEAMSARGYDGVRMGRGSQTNIFPQSMSKIRNALSPEARAGGGAVQQLKGAASGLWERVKPNNPMDPSSIWHGHMDIPFTPFSAGMSMGAALGSQIIDPSDPMQGLKLAGMMAAGALATKPFYGQWMKHVQPDYLHQVPGNIGKLLTRRAEGGPVRGAAGAFYNQQRLAEIQAQSLHSELLRSQIEDTFGISTEYGTKPDLLQHLEAARGFLEAPKEVLHNLIRQAPPVQISPESHFIRGESPGTIGVYYPPGGGVGIAGLSHDVAGTATHEAAHVLDFRKQRDARLGARMPLQASMGAFAEHWSAAAQQMASPRAFSIAPEYLPSEYATTAPEEGFAEIVRAASAELRNQGFREELEGARVKPFRTIRDTLASHQVASYGPLRQASGILQRYATEHKLTPSGGQELKARLIEQAGLGDVFRPEYQRAIGRYAAGGYVTPRAEGGEVEEAPSWLTRAREAIAPLRRATEGAATPEPKFTPTGPKRAPRARPARAARPPRAPVAVESYFRDIQALTPAEVAELTAGTEFEGKLEPGAVAAAPVADEEELAAQDESQWGHAPAGEMPDWMRRTVSARTGVGPQIAPRLRPSAATAAGFRNIGKVLAAYRTAQAAPVAEPAPKTRRTRATPPPSVTPAAGTTLPGVQGLVLNPEGRWEVAPAAEPQVTPQEEPESVPIDTRPTGTRPLADAEKELRNLRIRMGKRGAQIQGGKAGVEEEDPAKRTKLRDRQAADRQRLADVQAEVDALKSGSLAPPGVSPVAVAAAAAGAPLATPPPAPKPASYQMVGGIPQMPADGFKTFEEREKWERAVQDAYKARSAARLAANIAAEAAGPAPAPAAAPTVTPRPKTVLPSSSLSPASQQLVDAVNARIASSHNATLTGHLKIVEHALRSGIKPTDLEQYLLSLGLKPKEAEPLIAMLGEAQIAAEAPAETGALAEFEASRARAMARPLPPTETAGYRGSRERAAATQVAPQVAGPTPEQRQETAAVIAHLDRTGLSHNERIMRAVLEGGTGIEDAARIMATLGVQAPAAEQLVARARQAAAPPQVRTRGAGMFQRLAGFVGGIGRRPRQTAQQTPAERVRSYTEPMLRAAGGPAGEQQGVYLVGERGPEIFVPHAPGYVLAHDQAKRAVSEGRVGRIGQRQYGGPVATEADALRHLQGLPTPDPVEQFMLSFLQGGNKLSDLEAMLQSPLAPPHVQAPAAAAAAFQGLMRQASPIAPQARAIEAGVGRIAGGLTGAGTGTADQQKRQNDELQKEFRAVQQLVAEYQILSGVREKDARATAQQIAASRVQTARQQDLAAQYRAAGLSNQEATTRSRQRAQQEMQAAGVTAEGPAAERGGGLRLFGQTPTQLLRAGAAVAGLNLGFNVMVGLARLVHQAIADTVDETVRLAQSTTRINIAYGQLTSGPGPSGGAAAIAGGFQRFQAAPLVAQTQGAYQQTAASLAPLADQYELTASEVRQLTTASAQLAAIWGGDQAQAAQALTGVLRGNSQAAEQYNIDLVDQYGRIRALGLTYQELASAIGPAAAAQQMMALQQQAVSVQVDAYNRGATEEQRQINELSRQWADFQTILGQIAAGPITGFLTQLNALLRETGQLLGAVGVSAPQQSPANTPRRAAGGPAVGPGAYLVGEKGPELFVPSSPGYVYSNAQTHGILGARAGGGPVGLGLPDAEAMEEAKQRFLLATALSGGPLNPLSPAIGLSAVALPPIAAAEQNSAPLRFATGALVAGTALAAALPTGGASAAALPLAAQLATGGTIAGGTIAGGFAGLVAPSFVGAAAQAAGQAAMPITQPVGQALGGAAGAVSDKLTGLSTNITQFDTNVRQVANTLPEPLKTLGNSAADAGDAVAGLAKAAADQATQIANNPPGQPLPPTVFPGGNIPMPDDRADRQRAQQADRDRDQRARSDAISAAQLQQSQAQNRVTEANARLQQVQAESQLRLYDINRSNVIVDGQRVSAAQAINQFTMQRLQLESQLVPLQLQQEQIQNRIRIIRQPNLETQRQSLVAQQAVLAPQVAVSRTQTAMTVARQNIQIGFLEAARGETPEEGTDFGANAAAIYSMATDPQRIKDQRELTLAQQQATETGAAVQADTIQKSLAAIPYEEQAQQIERATIMYQEQINAAQASSDAINRMLQMADLLADPARIAAQKDLNQATLDVANAAQKIAQNVVAAAGQGAPPVQQNTGELPQQAVPTATVSTQRGTPPSVQPPTAPPGPLSTPGTPIPGQGQAPTAQAAPTNVTPTPTGPVTYVTPTGNVTVPAGTAAPTARQATASAEADAAGQRAQAAGASADEVQAAAAEAYQRAMASGPGGTPAIGRGPRQSGGDVAAGGQYLVGEAGPEMFAPQQWGGGQDTLGVSNMLRATQLGDSLSGGGGGVADVAGMLRGAGMSPTPGNVHVALNMGNVAINNGMDLDSFQQATIDAATRGALQALRYGGMVTPHRVPLTVAGGRAF